MNLFAMHVGLFAKIVSQQCVCVCVRTHLCVSMSANVIEEHIDLISNHMLRWMDIIDAVCNGHVPGINEPHVEVLENVLHSKILNVTMEISKPLCVYVHLSGVFCLNDHLSGWASHEQSLNSLSDTEGPANEDVNGEGSEVLAKGDDDDGILVTWYPVNFPRDVAIIYH